MPKLKTYDAGAAASSVINTRRAQGSDFGGGGAGLEFAGKALMDLSEGMMAAKKRVDDRNDTVSRSVARNAYGADLTTSAGELKASGGVLESSALKDFGKNASDKAAEIIANHTGSAESKAKLTVTLNDLRGVAARNLSQVAIQQGNDLLQGQLNVEVDNIVNEAVDTGSVEQAFLAIDTAVAEAAPGMSKDKAIAEARAGKERVITELHKDYINEGFVEDARELLETPGIEQMVTPKALREMRTGIIKVDRENEKGRVKGEQKLEEISAISGIPVDQLTDAQRLRAAKLAPTTGPKTLQTKVDEYTIVVGTPPNQDQINRMAGVFIADGDGAPFGKGLTGLSLARMSNDAVAFAGNLLDDKEEALFMAAVTNYTQPVSFKNPDTGLIETRNPVLPPAVKEALARRGIPLPTAASAKAVPEGDPLSESAPPPDETIFGMAPNVTGPVAVASGIAGSTPVLGEFFRPDQIEQATSRVKLLTRNLVRVLQSNPRFNEGERKSIENDIDLSPKFFDTEHAFRNRVIGIDDALDVRQKAALALISAPLTSGPERIQAMREANALIRFRMHLGAPPVLSPEEAKKLPEGSPFRSKDGRVFINKAVEPDG